MTCPEIPNYPNGSTLSDTLNAVKGSTIYKGMEESIASISSSAGKFYSSISTELNAATAAVSGQIAAARATMARDLSIAQANMEATMRELLTSRAESDTTIPSINDVSSAADNLAVLKQGPAMLAAQNTAISTGMVNNDLVNSAFGLTASTNTPESVGLVTTDFMATVPPQTAPAKDPVTGAELVPVVIVYNPDFATFLSTSVGGVTNKTKMESMGIPLVDPDDITKTLAPVVGNLTASFASMSTTLTSGFNTLVGQASAATNAAIANLKANASAMIYGSSHNTTIASIKDMNLDPCQLVPLNVNKGLTTTSVYSPATPPPNPRVQGYASTKNALVENPPTTAPATEAPVTDRVARSEIDYYYENIVVPLKNQDESARNAFMASSVYTQILPAKEAANAVKSAKPDPATRTPEENATVANYESAVVTAKQTPEYIAHNNALNAFNEENRRYKTAVHAYATNASRSTLEAATRANLPNG